MLPYEEALRVLTGTAAPVSRAIEKPTQQPSEVALNQMEDAPPKQPLVALPERDPTLSERAASGALGTLAVIGNPLDMAGGVVRNILGGVSSAVTPGGYEMKNRGGVLAPLASPLTQEGRVEGRELLRKWGLADKNRDTWSNFAGGLALEIVTDPTTYIGGIGLVGNGFRALASIGFKKSAIAAIANQIAQEIAAESGKTLSRKIGSRAASHMVTARDMIERSEDVLKNKYDWMVKHNQLPRTAIYDTSDTVARESGKLPRLRSEEDIFDTIEGRWQQVTDPASEVYDPVLDQTVGRYADAAVPFVTDTYEWRNKAPRESMQKWVEKHAAKPAKGAPTPKPPTPDDLSGPPPDLGGPTPPSNLGGPSMPPGSIGPQPDPSGPTPDLGGPNPDPGGPGAAPDITDPQTPTGTDPGPVDPNSPLGPQPEPSGPDIDLPTGGGGTPPMSGGPAPIAINLKLLDGLGNQVAAMIDGGEWRRGGNALVYDAGATDEALNGFVVKVPREFSKPNTAITNDFKPVEHPLAALGLRVGQPVAENSQGVQLLLKQEGEEAGLEHLTAKYLPPQLRDSTYQSRVMEAAEMPQASYDKLAEEIKMISDNGYSIDPSKSNNVLIDRQNGRFNLVDIVENPEGIKSGLNEIAVMLMGNTYFSSYKGPDLTDSYRKIFDKTEAAVKRYGLPEELTTSGQWSKEHAGYKIEKSKDVVTPTPHRENIIKKITDLSNLSTEMSDIEKTNVPVRLVAIIDALGESRARRLGNVSADDIWNKIEDVSEMDANVRTVDGKTRVTRGVFAYRKGKPGGVLKFSALATASTFIHEPAHFLRSLLYDFGDDLAKKIESHYGVKDAEWTVDADESFARGLEGFAAYGKAPTKELQPVFEQLKDFLVSVYNKIKQLNPKEFKLIKDGASPQSQAIFSALFDDAAMKKLLEPAVAKPKGKKAKPALQFTGKLDELPTANAINKLSTYIEEVTPAIARAEGVAMEYGNMKDLTPDLVDARLGNIGLPTVGDIREQITSIEKSLKESAGTIPPTDPAGLAVWQATKANVDNALSRIESIKSKLSPPVATPVGRGAKPVQELMAEYAGILKKFPNATIDDWLGTLEDVDRSSIAGAEKLFDQRARAIASTVSTKTDVGTVVDVGGKTKIAYSVTDSDSGPVVNITEFVRDAAADVGSARAALNSLRSDIAASNPVSIVGVLPNQAAVNAVISEFGKDSIAFRSKGRAVKFETAFKSPEKYTATIKLREPSVRPPKITQVSARARAIEVASKPMTRATDPAAMAMSDLTNLATKVVPAVEPAAKVVDDITKTATAPKTGAASSVLSDVQREAIDKATSIPMYRGSRGGNTSAPVGPQYFSSNELFAKTYGTVSQHSLDIKNPLIVTNDEWHNYANSSFLPLEDIVKNIKAGGYDSVVNIRKTPKGDDLITVLVVDAKNSVTAPKVKTVDEGIAATSQTALAAKIADDISADHPKNVTVNRYYKQVKLTPSQKGVKVTSPDGVVFSGDRYGDVIIGSAIDAETGKPYSAVLHARTGYGISFDGTKTEQKQLAQMINDVGISLTFNSPDKIPASVASDLKALVNAWKNNDYTDLPEGLYESIAKKVDDGGSHAATHTVGQAHLSGNIRNVEYRKAIGPIIKNLAKEIPEFSFNPVMRVNEQGMLVYRDHYQFEFDPKTLLPRNMEVKPGDTVAFELSDFGVKGVKKEPVDVVKASLQNAGFKVSSNKNGLKATLGSDSVTVTGSGQNWTVAGGDNEASRLASRNVSSIAWNQPELVPGVVDDIPAATVQSPALKQDEVVDFRSASEMFEPKAIATIDKDSYKSRSKVVPMLIQDFLDLAEEGISEIKTAGVKELTDANKKFSNVPLLMLKASKESPTTVLAHSHEGRHRARRLLDMGYTHMPVELRHESIRWDQQLSPQSGFDYKKDFPTTMRGGDGSVAAKAGREVQFPITRDQVNTKYSELEAAHLDAPKFQAQSDPNILRQDEAVGSDNWFYSKLLRTIDDPKMPNKFTKDELIRTTERIDKKGDPYIERKGVLYRVKPEELDNADLDALFAEKKQVTKQELRDWVEAHTVKLEETVLGKKGSFSRDDIRAQAIKDTREVLGRANKLTPEVEDAAERWMKDSGDIDAYDTIDNALKDAGESGMEAMLKQAEEHLPAIKETQTKFERYTTPGGENYREVLIRLPEIQTLPSTGLYKLFSQMRRQLFDKYGDDFLNKATYEEVQKFEALESSASKALHPVRNYYKSSHWKEPNVLAHIRMNDRVGPNGEKILHVDEIQSDWHQAGRKKGYGPQTKQSVEAYYVVPHTGEKASIGFGKTEDEALKSIDPGWHPVLDSMGQKPQFSTTQKTISQGVPDAPFKKTWHELAMKRVMKEAVEGGYDKVTFTNGATQAERYDLSKQVDSIKAIGGSESGKYSLVIMKDGKPINSQLGLLGEIDAQGLEDTVGKELAQRIVNDLPPIDTTGWTADEGRYGWTVKDSSGKVVFTEMSADSEASAISKTAKSQGGLRTKEYSGLDLKVGGEGMKGFYDTMLPSFVNSYGKKWGVNVREALVDTGIPRIRWRADEDGGLWFGGEIESAIIEELPGGVFAAQIEDVNVRPANGDYFNSFEEAERGVARLARELGTEGLGGGDSVFAVHEFDVTPAMKEEILGEGQALYQNEIIKAESQAKLGLASLRTSISELLGPELGIKIADGLDVVTAAITQNRAAAALVGLFDKTVLDQVKLPLQERARLINKADVDSEKYVRNKFEQILVDLHATKLFDHDQAVATAGSATKAKDLLNQRSQAVIDFLEFAFKDPDKSMLVPGMRDSVLLKIRNLEEAIKEAKSEIKKAGAGADTDALTQRVQDLKTGLEDELALRKEIATAERILSNKEMAEKKIVELGLDGIRGTLIQMLDMHREAMNYANEMGYTIPELNDLFVTHWPRYKEAAGKKFRRDPGSGAILEKATAQYARTFRNLPGGQNVINRMAMDPGISGLVNRYPINTGAINDVVDMATGEIKSEAMPALRAYVAGKYGPDLVIDFDVTKIGKTNGFNPKSDTLFDEYIISMANLSPFHADQKMPLFGTSFVEDSMNYIRDVYRGAYTTRTIAQITAESIGHPEFFQARRLEDIKALHAAYGEKLALSENYAAAIEKVAGGSSISHTFDEMGIKSPKVWQRVIDNLPPEYAEIHANWEEFASQSYKEQLEAGKTIKVESFLPSGDKGTVSIKYDPDLDLLVMKEGRDWIPTTVEELNSLIRGEVNHWFLYNFGIDKDLANLFTSWRNPWRTPDSIATFVDAYDHVRDMWKTGMTSLWPAFHTRNIIGAAFNNAIFDAYDPSFSRLNPKRYWQPYMDAARMLEDETIEGLSKLDMFSGLTDAQATQMLKFAAFEQSVIGGNLGVASEGIHETFGALESLMPGHMDLKPTRGKILPSPVDATILDTINPIGMRGGIGYKPGKGLHTYDKDYSAWSRWGRAASQKSEGMVRLSAFIAYVKQGDSFDAAAAKVVRNHVDYNRLSKFERSVMTRIFPFYNWTRWMAPTILGELFNNPGGKLSQVVRVGNRSRSNDPGTPDDILDTIAIPMPGATEDGTRYITGFGLPFEDPLDLVKGIVSLNPVETFQGVLQRSWVPKALVELTSGRSGFFKGPDGYGQDMSALDPPVGRTLQNIKDLVTGERTKEASPVLGSSTLELALANSPFSRATNVARTLTDKRKLVDHPVDLFLNTLTGIRVRHITDNALDRNYQQRIMNELKQAGAREFRRTYVPDEKLEAMPTEEQEMTTRLLEELKVIDKRFKSRKHNETIKKAIAEQG